jgi:hypothetical protein
MTDLAGLRTRVLQTLGDSGSGRYAQSLLDESLRQALYEYSLAWPQIKETVITVNSTGRGQSLVAQSGLLAVLEVVFPYEAGSADPQATSDYYFYWLVGVPVLHLTGSQVPVEGDQIFLAYAALHTLKDLDGAGSSSIRSDHESLLVTGAAGHAATTRSAAVVEGYTNKSSVGPLMEWGNRQLVDFRSGLAILRQQTAPARPFTGWPQGGWSIDLWDKRDHAD